MDAKCYILEVSFGMISQKSSTDSHILKLINLNVYDGGRFLNRISDYLGTQKPDIITLQEAYSCKNTSAPLRFHTISAFLPYFSQYYCFFSPEFQSDTNFGPVNIGNAILSKYPISQMKTVFLNGAYGVYPLTDIEPAHYPKNMQTCKIHAPKSSFYLCNLHGVWERTTKDTFSRFQMVQTILKNTQRRRSILAGDFNISMDTKAMTQVRNTYTQVFRQIRSTLNFNLKDAAPYAPDIDTAVDMIFTSPEIAIVNKKLPRINISDHYPLEIEFAIDTID
jgi:endonuclease/exonuclease/phosphatase family metal-dependent hydrolase